MRHWKKVAFSMALMTTLFVSGCGKEEEPVSLDEVLEETDILSVKTEDEIANAEEVKNFGQKAVGEIEKILYRIDFKSEENNQAVLSAYIKNPETLENLTTYTQQFVPYGMDIKKIIFNQQTEELYMQNGRYFYQVTAEAQYVRAGYAGIEAFTYFLMVNEDKKGNFYIEDIRWEKGHLLDGYQLLSNQGLENVSKEKVQKFLKNALGFETTDKELAVQNAARLFQTEETARTFIEPFAFHLSEKRTLDNFAFDESSFSVYETLPEGKESFSIVSEGKIGISYTTASGMEKKEAYTFELTMSQRNPDNEDFTYVIDDIVLTPLTDFNWTE